MSLGVPREKIIVGIPAYGRSYTLLTGQKGLHAPGLLHCSMNILIRLLSSLANGPGQPGQYTKTRGFLSYYEVSAIHQQITHCQLSVWF